MISNTKLERGDTIPVEVFLTQLCNEEILLNLHPNQYSMQILTVRTIKKVKVLWDSSLQLST